MVVLDANAEAVVRALPIDRLHPHELAFKVIDPRAVIGLGIALEAGRVHVVPILPGEPSSGGIVGNVDL
ncbi:hypothetical protein GCM10009594_22710 [Kocuria palustris]